jgi:hypothetical protein
MTAALKPHRLKDSERHGEIYIERLLVGHNKQQGCLKDVCDGGSTHL